MKKEFLNGSPIPYDKPIDKLKELLFSPKMKDFSLACEALSYSNDAEAYALLKSFIDHKDKYRRLYILKTIFRMPFSAELVSYLENAISSDDMMFVKAALDVIAEHKIKVSQDILRASVAKHLSKLGFEVYSLAVLDTSDENYLYLTDIFTKSNDCFKKELLCDILQEKYLPGRASELFELFKNDKFAKIRLEAIKLGKKYGFDVSEFLSDIDGHVRKFASRPDMNLAFLSEYASSFTVDISDGLESAVIYNPFGNDNIYVDYMRDDEYEPFMVRFSYQHVHLGDIESVKKWIDRIISGELFAIEFFKDGRDCFGGEITKEYLGHLSCDSLEQFLSDCGLSIRNISANSFKIRGWSGTNDIDGIIVKNNNNINIETSAVNLKNL